MVAQMVPLSPMLDPLGGLNSGGHATPPNLEAVEASHTPLRSFNNGFLEATIIIPGGRTYNRMIMDYDLIGSHPVPKTGP